MSRSGCWTGVAREGLSAVTAGYRPWGLYSTDGGWERVIGDHLVVWLGFGVGKGFVPADERLPQPARYEHVTGHRRGGGRVGAQGGRWALVAVTKCGLVDIGSQQPLGSSALPRSFTM